MAQLPRVKIFAASLEMLMILPEEKAGRVIQAAGRYFKYGELPEKLDSTEAIVFERLKENVDESAESYSGICRRNRNNARGAKEAICNPMATQWDTSGNPKEPKAEAEAEAEAEDIKTSPSISPSNVKRRPNDIAFSRFWSAYPKRVGKQAARKAFDKSIKATDIDTILKAIELQRQSPQWAKDNGQYIPNPATWLNQGRWDDETEVETFGQAKQSDFSGFKIGTVL